MAAEKLDRYVGKLSAEQIVKGINCAIRNSMRLLQDAESLCHNNRYPSAVALAILAIEEASKVSLLRGLAVARSIEDVRDSWKEYRTHTRKNQLLAMPDFVASGARCLEDFKPLCAESEYPQLIENLKQISIYSDCLGKAHWSIPSEVIDEKLATQIVALAKALIGNKEEITEKEIEIWIKHVGPVWKHDMELMKAAVKNYFIEMHDQGLLKSDIADALRFIDGKKYWIQ